MKFATAVASLALAAVALADRPPPPAPAYPPPPPPPAYPPPAPKYAPAPITPPVYQYQYAVKDGYSGVDFDANEERDSYNTNGGWRVLLPDGRTQIVTYSVTSPDSGVVMDVTYEGEAQYPAEAPKYPAPAPPSYPAPAPPPSYPPPPPPSYGYYRTN